ncbi:MAG: hypothetical protein K2X48_08690, partial [Chitinophagaceae bacterium]|nr:hypothetical protein [Chitinophagaceae bacterium]
KLNKERQADVGFGSSQTQMIKNIFTVAPTLVKLLGSMAHNTLIYVIRCCFPKKTGIENQHFNVIHFVLLLVQSNLPFNAVILP